MNDTPPLPRVYKTELMRDVEAMFFGRDIRLVLIDLLDRHHSVRGVARRLGLSPHTIRNWISQLGLVTEQRTRARMRQSDE
jgi:transposase-like protein